MAAVGNSAVGCDSVFDGAKGERIVSRSPGKDQTESQSTNKPTRRITVVAEPGRGLVNRKGLSDA